VNDSTDYIEALKEMKQNSVTRESYDKLKSENKKLLDALVNGKEIDIKKEEPVDISKLRKDLFNRDGQMSNLDYVSTALKLRDALIEKGERDPFLPYGEKVNLTAEHYDKAEQVATVLRECVDFADGDSGIFSAELQRRLKDSMPTRRK
jgi:hypothetical protein